MNSFPPKFFILVQSRCTYGGCKPVITMKARVVRDYNCHAIPIYRGDSMGGVGDDFACNKKKTNSTIQKYL